MLRQNYKAAQERPSTQWVQLHRFFKRIRMSRCAFICMNWDTVIEEKLFETKGMSTIDYGCGARYVELSARGVDLPTLEPAPVIKVLKMHGSTNWLYCDNCRELLWCRPRDSLKIADLLFRPQDWAEVKRASGTKGRFRTRQYRCPVCKAKALGTRLATFSYRKALDFPMFQKSWLAAEALLREAKTWIFIGYSLPAADYEFKYLLKRIQAARTGAPRLVLITGGDKERAEATYRNYQRFFGRGISRVQGKETYFDDGLGGKGLVHLTKCGALREG